MGDQELRVPTPDYAGPLLSDVIPAAALAVGGATRAVPRVGTVRLFLRAQGAAERVGCELPV